jgi:benzaldehyde dehydrogenase (NAD)
MRAELDLAVDERWLSPAQNSVAVSEPGNGKSLFSLRMADAADVADAAGRARAAQTGWFAMTYDERARVLRKAADLMEANADLYLQWIVRETGSVPAKAGFETSLAVKAFREAAAMPSQPQGLILPSDPGKLSFCRRMPLGVVAVISPFNFPMYLGLRAVAPALAVGNAVILKPDPRTTVSGGLLLARLLAAAGLPPDVLIVLPGGAEAGEALCTDPNVAMVQFTGSTAVGRKIGALAGGNLKKLSLELGGKNSLIILDDADPDLAASNAAWSAYLHQGQICMSSGRILVQEPIFAAVAERLAKKAAALPVGDPSTGKVALGPIISAGQADHARGIVEDSVAAGATLLAGGTVDGLFFRPTVLAGVTPDMRAFREEIFGPVAVLTSFKTDDDAVALANDTDYGLSAGVISASVGRAMTLGARLRTGLLHINDQTVADEVVNPFGGRGQSGNGTSIGGPANWDEFSQWQWVTVRDRAPQYPF